MTFQKRPIITSDRILNPRHTNTPMILMHGFITYCRPLIDYPLALMTSFKYMREKCEVIQRGIIKYLTGFTHRTSTNILYSMVELETIEFRGIRLSNRLRVRSEKLMPSSFYHQCYVLNNTRILKFIKSTVEVAEDLKSNKSAVKEHISGNKIIRKFSISHLGNKFEFDTFVRKVNLKTTTERDKEDLSEILAMYIRTIIRHDE